MESLPVRLNLACPLDLCIRGHFGSRYLAQAVGWWAFLPRPDPTLSLPAHLNSSWVWPLALSPQHGPLRSGELGEITVSLARAKLIQQLSSRKLTAKLFSQRSTLFGNGGCDGIAIFYPWITPTSSQEQWLN